MVMDTYVSTSTVEASIGDIEEEVQGARFALAQARAARGAAEHALRACQTDEQTRAQEFDAAVRRMREVSVAERERLQDVIRVAEEELRTWELRLADLDDGDVSVIDRSDMSFDERASLLDELRDQQAEVFIG
jgi:hypothetical protein